MPQKLKGHANRRRNLALGGHAAGAVGVVGRYARAGVAPVFLMDTAAGAYAARGAPIEGPGQLLTHATASARTVIDSDGLIKWAPHNLVEWSSDLTQSPWLKAAGVSVAAMQSPAPFGGLADHVTFATGGTSEFLRDTFSFISGVQYTFEVWVKYVSGDPEFQIDQGNGPSTGTLTATGTWQLITLTFTYSANSWVDIQSISGGTLAFWGARCFRSDLGGMQSTRDVADPTYVPTAGAAVYWPGVDHRPGTSVGAAIAGPELTSPESQVLRNATGAQEGGVWTLTATADFANVAELGVIEGGYAYKVRVSWSGNNEGRTISLNIGSGQLPISTAESGGGEYVVRSLVGGSIDAQIFVSGSVSGETFTLQLHSVRKVLGYTSEPRGIQGEPAATNIVTRSNDFSTWGAGATITPAALFSNGLALTKIEKNVDQDRRTFQIGATGAVKLCFSVHWAEGAEVGGTGAGPALLIYNLTAGASLGSQPLRNLPTEDMGGGVKRSWLAYDNTAQAHWTAGDELVVYCYCVGSGATSGHAFFGGVQVEIGTLVPSSYIPTNGATATRSALSAKKPAREFMPLGPELAGTDLSDYTEGSGGTGSVPAVGHIRIDGVGPDQIALVYRSLGTLTAGKLYRFTYRAIDYYSTVIVRIDPSPSGQDANNAYTFTGAPEKGKTVSVDILPPATGEYFVQIWTRNFDDSNDHFATYADVSVREVLQDEITVFAEWSYKEAPASGVGFAYELHAPNRADAKHSLSVTTAGTFQAEVNAAAYASQANYSQANTPTGAVQRCAMRVKTNDFLASFNGDVRSVDAVGTWPAKAPSTLSLLMSGLGFEPMFGHLRKLIIYPAALSDAEVRALATPDVIPSLNLVFDESTNSFVDEELTI